MEIDKLEVCPFVPNHFIRKEKLALHLIKCRNSLSKNSPYYKSAWNKVVCKYNSTHYVDKDELEMHYKVCEFSKKQPINYEKFAWEKFVGCDVVNNTEEDWEDQDIEAYNPMKKAKDKNILFSPVGLTEEQKKEYLQIKKFNSKKSCYNSKNSFSYESKNSISSDSNSDSNSDQNDSYCSKISKSTMTDNILVIPKYYPLRRPFN